MSLFSLRNAAASLLATMSMCSSGSAQERESAEFMRRREQAFYAPRTVPLPGGAADARLKAIHQMERMPKGRDAGSSEIWTLIGPRPTITIGGDSSAGGPLASGRVSALAVDPTNPDVVYLGAALGGVWKSMDGGRNWLPITDDQPSLAIGSLAIDPSNPNVVYAGTGEENFSGDSYYGAGILKSTDGGRTWKNTGTMFGGPSSSTSGGAFIGSLAVSPADGRILLAGVKGKSGQPDGIYRSSDAGATWQVVLEGAPGTGVVYDPKRPSIVYAALGAIDGSSANGIYKSTDGGFTWARSINGIPSGIGRISLTLSASKPEVLYAAIATPKEFTPLGVFKSTDGGASWSEANTPSYCYKSCWYANTIQVAPDNPDVVLVGGLTFYLSRDGGKTWQGVSQGANGNMIHWDMHALAFSSNGSRLYIGTDGGVYRGENIGSVPTEEIGWNNLNDTLAITQFYAGCSAHPDSTDFIVCGTQDNGIQIYTGGPVWRMIAGGDGGYTAVDTARPSMYYVTGAGVIDIQKTSPFGLFRGFVEVTTGLEQVNWQHCAFTPPLTLDPANPLTVYYGCRRIYRSKDGAGIWEDISGDLLAPPGADPAFFTSIAVAPGLSRRVYAGSSDGRVHVSDNATAAGTVDWPDRSQGLPLRQIAAISVNSTNPDEAYAAVLGFSGFGDSLGHVFRTRDAGRTWVDVSSNLPNVPVNAIVLDESVRNTMYAGTDIGVFRTTDGGASWSPLGQGLPRVAVVDLRLHPGARLLRAATHGRSMWELSLPPQLAAPAPLRIQSAEPTLQAGPGLPANLRIHGSGFIPGSVVRWNGEERETRYVSDRELSVSLPFSEFLQPGRASLSVRQSSGGTISNVINYDTGDAPQITAIHNGSGSSTAGTLAPGSIGTLFGYNLAPAQLSPGTGTPGQTLGGAIVEFKSYVTHLAYPAALLYVSPTQINFQVPWSVPVDSTLDVDVVQGTRMSQPYSSAVSKYSPGIFSLDGTGAGQGWVVCASDGLIAGPRSEGSRPAKRGESVVINATGLGPYWTEGGNQPQPTIGALDVRIGGIPATVSNSVAVQPLTGLYQVTAQVPSNAPSGSAVAVTVLAGGIVSNQVTIAIE